MKKSNKFFEKVKNIFGKKKSDEFEVFDEEESLQEYSDETDSSNEEHEELSLSEMEMGDLTQPETLSSDIDQEEFEEDQDITDPNFAISQEVENSKNFQDFHLRKKGLKGIAAKFQRKFKKASKGLSKNPTLAKAKGKKLLSKLGQAGEGNSIDPNEVLERLFSPTNRPLIHKMFVYSLLVFSTYGVGKLGAQFIQKYFAPKKTIRPFFNTSAKPKVNYAKDVNGIVAANLFDVKSSDKVEEKPKDKNIASEEKICRTSSKRSTLPLKLLNTVVLQDTVKSIASIQVRSNRSPNIVREGEKIESLAEIGKIGRLKLVFKNLDSRLCEYIENKKLKSKITRSQVQIHSPAQGKKIMKEYKREGIKVEGNSYKIKKNVREDMLSNISEVLTQARAIQIKNPDGSLCFKMTEVVPGSIYNQIGIANNDTICGIDGKKISNMNDIMSMFGRFKDIDSLQLAVKRDGIEQNFDYIFE